MNYFLKERIFILRVLLSEAAEAVVKYARGCPEEAALQSATHFTVSVKFGN